MPNEITRCPWGDTADAQMREYHDTMYVKNGVAIIQSDVPLITDTQSALDLIATVQYETGCDCIAIPKSAVAEKFFILSSGLAGEVLQKFVTYHVKVAIIGDFSRYTSKPLA